tara:strand:- start:1810 stop:2181 length:372 start_codon:yes stop_codon:yes gene_type:complete
MSDKLDALVEQIGNLTMQEAADMAKMMEEKWGIQASNIQPSAAPVVEEAKATKDVFLVGYEDSKKIMVIKTIRPILDLGLLEAKNYVEKSASEKVEVKTDLEPAEAEKISKELIAAGGKVEVK